MKTDTQLQQDVMSELTWEPSVDHADIGVAVMDGVVSLNGYVKSYAEKLAAERAAKRVSGVHALAEELTVRYDWAPKTADHEIAKRIVDIYKWNVLIPEDDIQVKVEHGWVTLSGEVVWEYQRNEAKKAAAKINGVTGVSNDLRIAERVDPVDIRERIEEAFERQADLDAASVTVQTDGSKVTLGGKVRAWHERKVAERAAWAAPGVTRVEDKIMVV